MQAVADQSTAVIVPQTGGAAELISSFIDTLAPAHTVARHNHPQYPERTPVPDNLVPWSVEWLDYTPLYCVDPSIIKADCTQKLRPGTNPASLFADPDDLDRIPQSMTLAERIRCEERKMWNFWGIPTVMGVGSLDCMTR